MTKMSEADQAFVEQMVREHSEGKEIPIVADVRDSEGNVNISVNKPHWLKRPRTWAAVVIVIPFIVAAVVYSFIARINTALGPGTIEYLAGSELSPEMVAAANQSGFGWLPEAIQLYSMRHLIVAIVFLVFFVIAGILMFIDISQDNKRVREAVERAHAEVGEDTDDTEDAETTEDTSEGAESAAEGTASRHHSDSRQSTAQGAETEPGTVVTDTDTSTESTTQQN